MIASKSPAQIFRPRLKAGVAAIALVVLTGCSGQTDLYDYLSSDKPSASSNAPATALQQPPGGPAAQPANAAAGSYAGLDNTEAALAAARPSSGIEKVSLKNAQGVAVTVDDLPITNFDISQRINLENALGGRVGTDFATRKRILGTLVNEKVAKAKASKLGFQLTDKQLDERISGMTQRMKISRADLRKRLGEKGVNETTLKNQIEGSIYIRWVMQQQKVDTDIKVDQAKVDAKLNEIMSDPRMKPITVISVQQVDLPVENPKSAMGQHLMYARAVEAQQIMQRYKGCNSIKSASRDIFNVKVARRMEADLDKLPKELRAALVKAGTRKLIGPVPGPTGIKLFANCGTRKIRPPAPDRSQIEAAVRNEQFEDLIQQAMAEARKEAFVDYKDPAFRP
ncbi:MAG: SurA N-terminal domain-containing protein [Anderseniella sp.]|nr:SurA N-terminal domain-containing protein [Anderseniella sp.]